MNYLIYENYKSKRTDCFLSERNEKKKKKVCITFRLSGSTPENIVGCILFPARDKKYFNTQRCIVY